jgi:hypothetical protein
MRPPFLLTGGPAADKSLTALRVVRWPLLVCIRRAINASGKTRSTVEAHAAVPAAAEAMRAYLDSPGERLLDWVTEGEVG